MIMGMGWDACEFHEDAFCLDDDTCAPLAEYKWYQPPIPAEPDDLYYGWDEFSSCCNTLVADDWYCDTEDPVYAVHWWGSYQGWTQTVPPEELFDHFHIVVWTDVPAGFDEPFSHPGTVVHDVYATEYSWQFVGWEYDPRTGQYEAVFRYDCYLDPSEYFFQEAGDNIYWLTIAAGYCGMPPGDHPWGWMTRPRDDASQAPDAAVIMPNPMMLGTPPGTTWEEIGGGAPIYWPDNAQPWDMAFELSSRSLLETTKWDRPPLPNPDSVHPECYFGWDEWSAWGTPQIVGDDWVCADDQPVAVVEWWGSYQNWEGDEPPPNRPSGFRIGVWTDVPAGPVDPSFSHPGELLHQWFVDGHDVTERYVGCDYHPGPPEVMESTFRYRYRIPYAEWFYQGGAGFPTIHWLTVAAVYDDIPCACSGDFDHDGDVDGDDQAFMAACMASVPSGECLWVDLNCNGTIDMLDTAIFANQFAVGWPDPQFCAEPPQAEYVWGWTTRLRDPFSIAPDVAVRMWQPYDIEYTDGEPIDSPVGPASGWDTAFKLSSVYFGEADLKWSQPPLAYEPPDAYSGWDEQSVWHMVGVEPANVAADDWVCRAAEPVTDVHWWGSYIDWRVNEPPADVPDHFHITIWTDVPAGVGEPFSHPGTVIHEIVTDPGLAGIVETFVGWDFDPATGTFEACFKYDLDLPQEHWFYQDPAGLNTIYWISIAACYEPEPMPNRYLWGWTTRQRWAASAAPDAAVRVFNPQAPVMGSAYVDGAPIPWPAPIESWADMAFVLRNDCGPQHYFGDVTDTGPDCPPPPPNTDRSGCDVPVELPDIVYVLNAFGEGDAWEVCHPNADLMSAGADPCALDGAIALPDIVAVLNAFAGQYDCPSECPCPPPAPPYVAEYFNSGCLPEADRGTMGCTAADQFEFDGEPGGFHVIHSNATYNCCPDDIVVTVSLEGDELRMTETEVAEMPCPCTCCYEVESTVVGLGSGVHTVRYCWSDYETGPECIVRLVHVP